jgi:hypothetical protein
MMCSRSSFSYECISAHAFSAVKRSQAVAQGGGHPRFAITAGDIRLHESYWLCRQPYRMLNLIQVLCQHVTFLSTELQACFHYNMLRTSDLSVRAWIKNGFEQ